MKKTVSILLALIMALCVLPAAMAEKANLNVYASGRFSKSYELYTGPGTNYRRVENATYGGGGAARIYGIDASGWIMIGYQTGKGNYRIGYITPQAYSDMTVNSGEVNNNLTFSAIDGVITGGCNLTDDPVINNVSFAWMNEGTDVTILATMGTDWVYIEAMGPSSLMRGFVRSWCIEEKKAKTVDYRNPQPFTSLEDYAQGRFDKSFDVFSGPGEYYYRADGAVLNAGKIARLYGVTGNWLMIGYSVNSYDYRIGYIPLSALDGLYEQNGAIVSELKFNSSKLKTNCRAALTDDPVMNNKVIYMVPENTEVTVLAQLGTWTYVEVMGNSSMMRGFLRSTDLSEKGTDTSIPNNYYHDSGKGINLPAYLTVNFKTSANVYSGPGTYYYRANNGSAKMGGGNCRVYGIVDNWCMIGYGLSNGAYRIGYVELDALPKAGLNVPYLDLLSIKMTLYKDVSMTDDIVMFKQVTANLKKGASVTFLALHQDNSGNRWAYVEISASSGLMRGFIPASALGM